jgi:hypothetical protein
MKEDTRLTWKQKEFAKTYVENEGNATKSALQVYKNSSENAAAVEGARQLRKAKMQNEIMSITEGEGITASWIKKLHARRATDSKRSENSQDKNLRNLGEMAQLYKNPEEEKKVQTLNITNITNYIDKTYATKDNLKTAGVEVDSLSEESPLEDL